jgi:hypothetical protein
MVQNSERPMVKLATRLSLAVALSTVLLEGCSATSKIPEPEAFRVSNVCQLAQAEDPYFGRAFAKDPNRRSIADHYSMLLYAMKEPFLACGERPQDSLRILYSGTMAPDVLAVRMTHDVDRFEAASVTISRRQDGSWPVTNRRTREVTAKEWNELLRRVESLNPWSLPAYRDEEPVVDGETWILEIRTGERHHVVLRRMMEPNYLGVARDLFSLAGANLPDTLRPDR